MFYIDILDLHKLDQSSGKNLFWLLIRVTVLTNGLGTQPSTCKLYSM